MVLGPSNCQPKRQVHVMERIEIAVSSDGGQLHTAAAWEPRTGACLATWHGGGVAAPRGLAILAGDYLVSVERTKPLLHFWPLCQQQPVTGLRNVLPGRGTAFAVSPDGYYCVAAVEEKIYVWQMASGALVAQLSRHYQHVTSLKFCDDGSHFVSAGEDGLVLVWSLANVLSESTTDSSEPLHIFSDHSLPVNDIYIGKGGIRSRLYTVSTDRTCKIYNLASGELLLNVVFDKSLTAVTVNLIETDIFVGTSDGDIYQFSTVNPPRTREYYVSDKDTNQKFSGHTDTVTALSVSLDGETLISGSMDEKMLVWHVPSRQKIHVIPHKGPVFNVFFTVAPKNMFTDNFEPSIVLQSLQRVPSADSSIEILTKTSTDFWHDVPDQDYNLPIGTSNNTQASANIDEMNDELNRLRKANASLYRFTLSNLLKDVA